MRTGRYLRIIVTMLMLLMYGVGEVWAQVTAIEPTNIIINGGTKNGDIYTIKDGETSTGTIGVSVSGREVTLVLTPAASYSTKTDLITVEKMVSTFAPRRAPELADLISGTMYTHGAERIDANIINKIENPNSADYVFTVPPGYDGAYVTVTFVETTLASPATQITSLSEITSASGNYILVRDIDASGNTSIASFSGTLEAAINPTTHMPYKIYNLSNPLFTTLTGTVKNVVLDNVQITSGTDGKVGAICCEATGNSRIFNCGILATNSTLDAEGIFATSSSSVSGSSTDVVGGLVGELSGTARVINCFSYANITGGGTVGGLVGNNTVATTSANLGTMVMNCMFYGDIDEGCTSKAPIYNGTIITNDGDADGVNNFNYFWAGASYVENKDIDVYNCALSAETRFLQRFEFFRNLLNSNRELAAWWVTGSANDKGQMMKWVLEPNQIGTATPFPILKTPGKYYSVVNYDADHAEEIDANNKYRNEGRKLTNMGGTGANAGKLAVTIQMGDGAVFTRPENAAITLKQGETEKTIYLVITDKDTAHYNFNYGKVQLPYYNDYGTNNYTGNRVVTGWKIVSITVNGTATTTGTGSYTTGADDVTYTDGELTATPYNFADRNSTKKDLYSVSGRVFNQGAYWDVPDGVTAITIEPYWGKAVYLADEYWDVVYLNGTGNDLTKAGSTQDAMTTAANVTTVGGGQRGTSFNGQVVFTFIENAISSSKDNGLFNGVTGTPANQTVYDYAVVLVGNYHHTTSPNADNSKPYTVTSVDLDGDNEPDYSLMLRFNGRTKFHPVRYDFLNLIGLGMAQKTTGGTGSYNLGIMQPKYWFEVTNTALFRVTQFEYSPSDRIKKPIILQGGVIEQWVTQQQNAGDLVEYFHVGGNVWFKEFHRGSHQDNAGKSTPHPPVSVTGGDFDKFYLTGLYQSQATIYDDNAECYISGGRFGKMAGAGMEGIGTSNGKGNVTWIIDHADIKEFYGGGINYDKPIHGNIHTIISNSYVDLFCGGPKFGDMEENRTVKTIATNCTFGTYFGAGYGGNSYNRYAPKNKEHLTADPDWNSWVTAEYKQDYSSTYKGVSTQIDYQYIPESSNTMNVARLWVEFVGFSLATTNDVTSNLTGCTVKGNFYGGGSLGKVDGDATSTLTDCTVNGSVFGAGYSGSTPTVEVMPMQFIIQPGYDNQAGSFSDGVVPSKTTTPPTVTYTWKHRDNVASTATAIDKTNHILYTSEDLTSLGTVTGNATLNITGTTKVEGSVYGGGEESNVSGNTEITMTGGTVNGNVFGGGKGEADEFTCAKAMVGVVDDGVTENTENGKTTYTLKDGGTTVSISNGRVKGNVYGGGEVGRVERNTIVTIGDAENATTPIIEGSVFGAGAGVETHGYSALVRGNATVTIQGSAQVWQNVYGGGEKASVGRYYVCSSEVDINTYHVPIGMPCYLKAGGKCTVSILGSASIGTDDDENTGHVFGAGQGLNPHAVTYTYQSNETKPYRMKNDNSWEYFASESDYLTFVETLAIASETDVIIGGKRETTGESAGTITPSGNPTIKGTVYGGSESGFVYHGTDVTIKNGTINVDVFGGGKGLATYAEAGRVRENTKITMSDGTVKGNIYGGGSLGDVGKINKTLTGYNYKWTDDAVSNSDAADKTYEWNNTGKCEIEINGGTIGTDNDNTTGHVFGAGKGATSSFFCEKAMVYTTDVSITNGTVKGNIYGGGQLGRVEDNTVVTIGTANEATGSKKPDIKGGVFGAGAGVATHGYSALVRGNSTVTVQGIAEIEKNVYGGGEVASVGRFRVENSLPKEPLSGGTCTVTIKGNAKVGTGSDGGSVYGACKGVEPDYANATGHVINTSESVAFTDENDYLAFLQTLALTSHTLVTIDGNASVNGSVFGGGRRGITLGDVTVNMTGGTVNQDVYGGGALANTNTGNWNDDYGSVAGITANTTDVKGYYTRTGAGTTESPYVYTKIETSTTAAENTTYYSKDSWAHATLKSEQYKTFVNILGGKVFHDVYGGGLGDASTPAYVWGDVKVNLNGLEKAYYNANSTTYSSLSMVQVDLDNTNSDYMIPSSTKGAIVNRVFGCNNLNGTPKGKVRVHVFATQNVNTNTIAKTDKYAHPVQGENDTENSKETSLEYLQRLINAAYVKDNQGDPTNDLLPGITETAVITAAQDTHDANNPAATEEQLNDAITNVQQELMKLYDVEAVYGGGNQAEYYPVDADSETEATKEAARPEVYIDGCDYTSIKEVYGGGNAASTPATYVRVNAAYEINEVFGGGNGRDNLFVTENATTVEYENPGANVGYHNYTHWGTEGADGVIPAIEKDDAGTPEDRANSNYRYGSGIATTWVTGGRIHNVYGGSNEKGNVSTTAVSVYQEADDSCPLIIDETYGGGKNSQMDGTIDLSLKCVQNMKEIFGGAKNADVNDDIVLNITNGTFEKVFGGNNTSGAINGSITVNVKEEGCSPIKIDELYGGGYLAGYSIYGYKNDANKTPRTKLEFKTALIDAIGSNITDSGKKEAVATTLADARNIDQSVIQAALTANNITDDIAGALKTAFGTAGLLGFPKNDPRINVISATRIDDIFGGGYEAMVIGSPRVNVNMTEGAIEVKKVEKTSTDQIPNNDSDHYTTTEGSGESEKTYVYKDANGEFYKLADLTPVEGNKYTSTLALGQIGNIYGGGNKADIQGNTYVEIGTGQWVTTWDANGNPVWGTEDANGNKYIYNEQSAARNYTEQECIDYNALLEGAMSSTDALTEEQADAYNTAMSESKSAGTTLSEDEANAYNATLPGAVTTNDIKPAVWAWYKVGVANDPGTTTTPTPARNAAQITGDVFGGGKGLEDNFLCDKAMVGIAGAGVDANNNPTDYPDGNTNVTIANGTIAGSVYGGGEVGRVEMNTMVTIGIGDGVANEANATSAPVITGNVFGGGKGVKTHGYSALVRGNPTVIVQGNAKVRGNVYGGGQIASVARYNVAKDNDEGAPYGVLKDMPYALRTNNSGFCTVTVRGYAEIGPESFEAGAKTTDYGHVFGAGKGIVPGPEGDYAFVAGTTKRMVAIRDENGNITGNEWDYFTAGEAAYITFIKTLALSSQTDVTIDGHATVKGSVFGGSESGFVQFDTNVTVKNGTIGTRSKGGADFGNVYGGGKGDAVHTGSSNNIYYVDAGLVKGNTKVKIEGGTILHNIYGGGAFGSVGEFTYDDDGMPIGRRTYTVNNEVHNTTGGNTEIYITGGEIGTNGDENGMVFGSSRGDVGAPGSIHDKLAWVYDTHVAIGDTTENATVTTTTPLIKGSIYGGGENGHNFRSSYVRINGGTIGITSGEAIGTYTAGGATYPYRGNVYGGGCGTDKYDSDNDGVNDAYNPLAGIVYGNARINMTDGQVVHNMYGAGAMGSVGRTITTSANNVETTTVSGGETTITISGGTMGVDGTAGEGNVFGAARGSADATSNEYALVRDHTTVNISGGTVWGNVYGGGELGCVGRYVISTDMRNFYWTNTLLTEIDQEDPDTYTYNNTGVCNVNISGGTVGNVFGGGKGKDDTFWCEKGIAYSTNVSITGGTVNHNVYGGGQVGRVETNAIVKIGPDSGTSSPEIKGDVFGAGAGVETHGYSALVRGNTTVTVQSSAKVDGNVYGGGELAAVGKYALVTLENQTQHPGLEVGMPYSLVDENLGVCNVTIKGSAVIGYNGTGHVFGGGKGKEPAYYLGTTDSYSSNNERPKRMMSYNPTLYNNNDNNPLKGLWAFSDASQKYVWEYFDTRAKYHTFLQTLALATRTVVSVEGSAQVNGSVYGGSESGFVQHNTELTIKGNSTIGVNGTAVTDGNVFGGGKGLDNFAEAGRVSGNTAVNINGGTVWRNVYGGGSLGPLGNFSYEVNPTTHSKTYTWTEGGTSNVTIDELNDNTTVIKGSVYGAGKGSNAKYECEPAMVLHSNVTVNNGTVNGTVYGGGEIGRVDQNTTVTIGKSGDNTSEPDIKHDVYGAGAGVDTHGYSALVRGNSTVTVQGKAKVGNSVYGGGKTASVGRFVVDATTSLPTSPVSGGICTVSIKDNASIGYDGGGDVYGACKGVEPGNWKTLPGHVTNQSDTPTLFEDEEDYLHFLKTLALTSNTEVTIGGSATVNGSVFGGGQRGVTLAGVKVNMTGGTVNNDVYGGGALADTNTENWDDTNNTLTKYHEETRLTRPSYQVKAVEVGESVVGLYVKESDEYHAASGEAVAETTYYEKVPGSSVAGYYTKSGNEYTLLTSGTADENTTYYRFTDTKVNLTGGMIKGDAYGGGLGRLGGAVAGVHYTQEEIDAAQEGDDAYGKTTDDWKVEPVAASANGAGAVKAMVYGDVFVNQGTPNIDEAPATAYTITYLTDDNSKQVVNSGRIFGCNNLNGSPKGNVIVTINKTVTGKDGSGNDIVRTVIERNQTTKEVTSVGTPHAYDVAAVYGGGNLADYEPADGDVKVRISSCDVSIEEVYGGGNAAKVPSTDVLVTGAYEIERVFGGGNGEDKYTLDGGTTWHANPGADIDGDANTLLKGGLIHEAYGGSNEKGTITGNITIDTGTGGLAGCPVKVDKLVGAGKNADVNGNLIMILGCYPTTKTPLIFAGADNANVNGDVELTITSGTFGQVFGGNNDGGAIRGHIKLNIEETGCNPIVIDELYLGGNNAAYSRYGYYVKTNETEAVNGNGVGASNETAILTNDKLTFVPRTSATDPHLPVKTYTKTGDTWTWTTDAITGNGAFEPYAQPELNVTSCTSIGEVFGGGYGVGGTMYANPTVNINMIPGEHAENVPTVMTAMNLTPADNPNKLGIIGDVYGGGNAADVIGSTIVNIGTAQKVKLHQNYDKTQRDETHDGYIYSNDQTVLGAYINGNVYGGGKGFADNFYCNKAMVGIDGAGADKVNYPNGYHDGNTNVTIANGTVNGNVYGGGRIGRVEMNTTVTIGDGEGVDETTETPTSAPVILGNVYGGGMGVKTHGYSALVRGNPTVIVQGNAKVRGSVFGAGEIASVARYKVKTEADDPDAPVGWPIGSPYALKDANSGFCKVTIGGYAEIGPEEPMHMVTASGRPDDEGHVFGAGMGVLPDEYDYMTHAQYVAAGHAEGDYKIDEHMPSRENISSWEHFTSEAAYIGFIQTLGLASQTDVTIKDHAFVKGSVYGGAFNGIVQYNTHVTIDGNCQIGAGKEIATRYPETYFNSNVPPIKSGSVEGGDAVYYDLECASWPYQRPYRPYDIFDEDANNGNKPKNASDGHTFFGNVFGGGSGYYAYRRKSAALDGAAWTKNQAKTDEIGQPVDANGYSDGVWLNTAGIVKGNTTVDIKGGHILTSVYGGNEQTDVKGSCTVNMSGGTLGVPRTLEQIAAHPVTCYLFGAGKGDPRINFNTWTNVNSVDVNISGGWIYGSVFGGGEDGHVYGDVAMTISSDSDPNTNNYNPTYADYFGGSATKIGTWGTSYVDGNVFGGGRGFTGDAQTAGSVGGNVKLSITGGEMLGSIYGGGRLASVGTSFEYPTLKDGSANPAYGNFIEDNVDLYYTQTECDEWNPTIEGYIPASTALTEQQATAYNTAITNNVITGNSKSSGDELSENEALAYNSKLDGFRTTTSVKAEKGTHSHGHVVIDISGGTIGGGKAGTDADLTAGYYDMKHSGNVFGGSMGRLKLLNGNINPIWPRMAQVKTATVNIYGNTDIKRNVYGGGELGTVRDNACVVIGGKMNPAVTDGTRIGTDFIWNNPTASDSIITFTNSDNPIIRRDVFGGGYGSNDFDTKTVFPVMEPIVENPNPSNPDDYEEHTYGFTPMQFAGCVGKNTFVHIKGAYIRKSVYGGGELASVGIINSRVKYVDNNAIEEEDVKFLEGDNKSYVYEHFHKHGDADNTDKSFALSWPYHFEYTPNYDGATHVNVTGGRLGLKDDDTETDFEDNGDIYGACKGEAGDYQKYVFCANVGSTEVMIDHTSSNNLTTYSGTADLIAGAVYGGGEDGHVIGNTKVTLKSGFVYHSLYGGGSGKGQFKKMLSKIPSERRIPTTNITGTEKDGDEYEATCYSITAGKVFGNTEVEMTGGYVVRNVYGGGNMGSVGKGNYAGGADDYSTAGYGETLNGNTNDADRTLWAGSNPSSLAFLNSGKCTVKITGGTIGYIDTTNPSNSMYPLKTDPQTDEKIPYDASLPYGNVFGGCRGESAPNILESPRYLYSPEFFVGYANETEVTIGKTRADFTSDDAYTTYLSSSDVSNLGKAGFAPKILGSVYGGGMDGHIRRDATVTINSGEIGLPFTEANQEILGGLTVTDNNEVSDNKQWLARGNVYGAGSGIGKYKYDFNYDGDYDDVIAYIRPGAENATTMKEEDFSTSAGSVTRFTTVNINGGIIHRNVYGGGSLSTVGAPKIPPTREDDPDRKGDTREGHGVGKQSLNRVNIAGTIGTPADFQAHYGGEVYGASRGQTNLGANFSNAVWTEVNLKEGANVQGNVFGGGDSGPVKQDSEVNVGATFSTTAESTMSIPQAGVSDDSKKFTITSNAKWEVNSNASWLTVNQKSGEGNGTITVTATANTGEGAEERTATITISGAGETKTITVTQAGNPTTNP